MNTRYWLRIVAGMLIVFVVGMFVIRGVNRAKEVVTNALPSYAGLFNTGFRLDGTRLGDIHRLQFLRSSPGRVDSAVVTVALSDSSDASELDGCRLMVSHSAPFNGSTRFSCVDAADSAQLALMPFGHLVVERTGKEVALYVPASAIGAAQGSSVHGIGTGDSGDVDIHVGDGRLSVMVGGREVVSAAGDSNGGSLVIRDHNGHPIVEISGDSLSGSLKIMDGNGRTRVDLHGRGKAADTTQ